MEYVNNFKKLKEIAHGDERRAFFLSKGPFTRYVLVGKKVHVFRVFSSPPRICPLVSEFITCKPFTTTWGVYGQASLFSHAKS